MIKGFSDYLVEQEKTIFFTFGRMNPPTVGHEKLLDKLAQAAGRNPYRVYLSQTVDKKKNPLDYTSKVKHARKMFPKHARSIMVNKNVKTFMQALSTMYEDGFANVVMVVGSDRVREFDILTKKYNNEKGRHGFYNFNSIKVISAGERDPDAEGVEGMSASKMRNVAAENDFTSFSQGLPRAVNNAMARKIFNDVRNGMGLKEQSEFARHIQLEKVSDTREAFVEGKLFELGDEVVIKESSEVGTISVMGANYVIVEMNDGKRLRKWLDDVVLVDGLEEATDKAPKWKRAGNDGELEIKFPTGRRFKIEKQYDHNIRHKGEWKVMEWDTRSRDWEWADTYSPKAYAKQMAMELGQYKNGKKVADYSHTFQYESLEESVKPHPEVVKAYKKTLDAEDKAADYNYGATKARVTRAQNHLSKKIKQHHPDLDMNGKIAIRTALQNMKEGAFSRMAAAQSSKADRMASTNKLKPGLDTYKKKPEWGTPESTAKAKSMTPGERKEQKTRQDSDIKTRSGSQPAAYHKGLSKATKIARDRHFKKYAEKPSDGPDKDSNYKPAPGDKNAKTKTSKYTRFVRKLLK